MSPLLYCPVSDLTFRAFRRLTSSPTRQHQSTILSSFVQRSRHAVKERRYRLEGQRQGRRSSWHRWHSFPIISVKNDEHAIDLSASSGSITSNCSIQHKHHEEHMHMSSSSAILSFSSEQAGRAFIVVADYTAYSSITRYSSTHGAAKEHT